MLHIFTKVGDSQTSGSDTDIVTQTHTHCVVYGLGGDSHFRYWHPSLRLTVTIWRSLCLWVSVTHWVRVTLSTHTHAHHSQTHTHAHHSQTHTHAHHSQTHTHAHHSQTHTHDITLRLTHTTSPRPHTHDITLRLTHTTSPRLTHFHSLSLSFDLFHTLTSPVTSHTRHHPLYGHIHRHHRYVALTTQWASRQTSHTRNHLRLFTRTRTKRQHAHVGHTQYAHCTRTRTLHTDIVNTHYALNAHALGRIRRTSSGTARTHLVQQ